MLESAVPCPVCKSTGTKRIGIQVQRIGRNEIHFCRECSDRYTTKKRAAGIYIVDREFRIPILPKWYIEIIRTEQTKTTEKDRRKAERKEKKLTEFLQKKGLVEPSETEAFTD